MNSIPCVDSERTTQNRIVNLLHDKRIIRVVDVGSCGCRVRPHARMDGGELVQLGLRGQLSLGVGGQL